MNWSLILVVSSAPVLAWALFISLCREIRVWRSVPRVAWCTACGYDLSGQRAGASARCSECGCDLADLGVRAVFPWTRMKQGMDAHRVARLSRWTLTIGSLPAIMFFVLAKPPYAFVRRDVMLFTLGQTPPGLGVLTVEQEHVWVETDMPSGEEGDYSHLGPTLSDTCIARSSVAGPPDLDLRDPAVTFEEIVAWVSGVDPGTTGRPAQRVALVLILRSAASQRFLEKRADEFGWYWPTQPLQPFASVTHTRNGVTSVLLPPASPSWRGLWSHVGSISFAHAEAKHWWRLAFVVFLLIVVVVLHIGLPRWYRMLCRARHRRWRWWLEQGP